MTCRRTRQADRDLATIYLDGLRDFGPRQSDRYLSDFEATFERIASQPRIARERMEFRPPIRLLPHGSHLIVYLIQSGDDVLIVRILHSRQDWQTLLA